MTNKEKQMKTLEKIATEEEWIAQMRKNFLGNNPAVSTKIGEIIGEGLGYITNITGGHITEIAFTGIGENEQV